jgi:ABC-type cobalt transport system substrate-binding protein
MKLIILIIALIIAAVLTGCTVTNNPDGSFTGSMDSATAVAIANQMFADK